MKELELIKPDNVLEVTVPKEFKKLGSFRPKIRGGKIFELNLESNEITEAHYEPSDKVNMDSTPTNGKLIVNKKCAYVEAINLENATRKFNSGKVLFIS